VFSFVPPAAEPADLPIQHPSDISINPRETDAQHPLLATPKFISVRKFSAVVGSGFRFEID
jgi:hypothetical protein